MSHSCPDYSWSPPFSDVDTDCVCLPGYVGDTLPLRAGGVCTECPLNTSCSSGVKDECPAHSQSPLGSENVTDCQCRPGFYWADGACTSCDADHYCLGNVSHTACPVHSTAPVRSASLESCTCAKGWYGPQGGHSHTPNPGPETRKPQTQTPNPEPENRKPEPETMNPKSETLNPNPKPGSCTECEGGYFCFAGAR